MKKDTINNVIRGRGTPESPDTRFLDTTRNAVDDGWDGMDLPEAVQTTVTQEHPKTIISHNQSPDIPFEASINPYRGCEHGCI